MTFRRYTAEDRDLTNESRFQLRKSQQLRFDFSALQAQLYLRMILTPPCLAATEAIRDVLEEVGPLWQTHNASRHFRTTRALKPRFVWQEALANS